MLNNDNVIIKISQFDDLDNYNKNCVKLQKLSLNSYLIREQRIYTDKKLTIDILTNSLKEIIQHFNIEYLKVENKLSSTYPVRAIKEKSIISEADFSRRFNEIKIIQDKLQKYGIQDTVQAVPEYDAESATILSVYLSDTEDKLLVYSQLLKRLDLFCSIIEKYKFTNKKLEIHRDKGFYFLLENGNILPFNALSTGEQHAVILFFELIFNTKKNSLVLVDEPEISLHVAWQEMFISDLLKICKLQNLQAIVATHSPMIIDIHSNLKYDLYGSPKRQQIL